MGVFESNFSKSAFITNTWKTNHVNGGKIQPEKYFGEIYKV